MSKANPSARISDSFATAFILYPPFSINPEFPDGFFITILFYGYRNRRKNDFASIPPNFTAGLHGKKSLDPYAVQIERHSGGCTQQTFRSGAFGFELDYAGKLLVIPHSPYHGLLYSNEQVAEDFERPWLSNVALRLFNFPDQKFPIKFLWDNGRARKEFVTNMDDMFSFNKLDLFSASHDSSLGEYGFG
jgi:hypothetical protein